MSAPVQPVVRRLRKQPTAGLSAWDHEAEPGDRRYIPKPELEGAWIVDLVLSSGRNKRDVGELTPKVVKKNGRPRIAQLHDDGLWYWMD
jgi:hypothetical protein